MGPIESKKLKILLIVKVNFRDIRASNCRPLSKVTYTNVPFSLQEIRKMNVSNFSIKGGRHSDTHLGRHLGDRGR